MTAKHRECDEEFANLETLVDKNEFAAAKESFEKFKTDMLHHFDMEEVVMFAEFNQNAEGGCNPTGVMVMEHDQMRQLFDQMEAALQNEERDRFLGLSETLLFVMGQHNMKEEQMMYNLADNALESEDIIQKMQSL